MNQPTLQTVKEAHERIRPHIHNTTVLTCSAIDKMAECSLFFKCENFQKAGAFKSRGACNVVFSLTEEEANRGVVTHSSGNHAGALARAANRRGIPAYIVMPSTAPDVKVGADPIRIPFYPVIPPVSTSPRGDNHRVSTKIPDCA